MTLCYGITRYAVVLINTMYTVRQRSVPHSPPDAGLLDGARILLRAEIDLELAGGIEQRGGVEAVLGNGTLSD